MDGLSTLCMGLRRSFSRLGKPKWKFWMALPKIQLRVLLLAWVGVCSRIRQIISPKLQAAQPWLLFATPSVGCLSLCGEVQGLPSRISVLCVLLKVSTDFRWGGTILSPAGYEHSQRQTVRRPSLDVLPVLTPGLGSEPVQGLYCLWEHMARAAGQAKGGKLLSGLLEACPHEHEEGLGSQGLRGGLGEGRSEACLLRWRRLGPCPHSAPCLLNRSRRHSPTLKEP